MVFDVLPTIHPAVLVLPAAFILWQAPRAIGHLVGVGILLGAAGLSWFVPEGAYGSVVLFGVFDVVLYNVDPFSRLMGLIFGLIGAAAVLYSWYSAAPKVQTAIALLYVGTSYGAVFGGDWLTLIIFWELMAITSTLLVWQYGSADAIRAGYRYALLHGIGGSLLLVAVVWQYLSTGTFLFAAGIAPGEPLIEAIAAIGIGVNVAFIGLHTWLPDTYPRPHIAASVFLSVYTTKTGVYVLYRAFPDGHLWLAYMGGAMAIFGAYAALLQDDMRRLLSYHIQSQVGYMVAGVGMGGALATAGAFAHVYNNILYKTLLFMVAGVIIYRTGEELLDDIGGLWHQMPVTAVAFTIAALSITGVPGFNGFISKGMVLDAATYEAELQTLWWMLMIGGVGTFLSFIKLGYFAFIEGSYSGSVRDANPGQSIAMGGVAVLCVVYGLWPDTLYTLLPGAGVSLSLQLPLAETLAGVGELGAYEAYTVGHVLEGLALGGAGLVGFLLLKGPLHHIGHVPDIDWVLNRGAFYGTQSLVAVVTTVFRTVDRGAVRLAKTAITVGHDPTETVRRLDAGRAILGDRVTHAFPLRAGIGVSVALLIAVTMLFLLTALVP